MGVIQKLNALDEKAGIPRTPPPGWWERNASWWWVNLAGAAVLAGTAVVFDAAWLSIGAIGSAFSGGFLYNERLRLLGRRSRVLALRRPD